MSGGGSTPRPKKIREYPVIIDETIKEKKKKPGRGGRGATILAGRMMSEHNQILKTKVGE